MMNHNPNMSGMRQPPQPYQQPDAGEFRREVPDVSLVFNPDERSLVLPHDRQQQQQSLLHRSRSVPGRISEPAPPPPPPRYRTPPPRPAPGTAGPQRSGPAWPSPASSAPLRPSPLTRPAVSSAALADVSISYEDGREVPRPAAVRRTPPAEPAAPRTAGSPVSSGGGSAAPLPSEPACCGAELRAVLRLVADNGRQLAQLRAQVRQLLSREPAAEAAPPARSVLLREAQTQTEEREAAPRPATAAAAVNTSFSLTPRRDTGTDPPPPAPPAVERAAAAGRVSEVTASGARENTVQLQRRRVQEWVAGAGWTEREQEPEPELTLRGLVLPAVPEQPPSPEPSLHVDMHEYQPSSGGSADGSEAEENAEMERPKPDRTFFQNVMGQVNQILDGAAGGGEPDGRQTETAGRSPVPAPQQREQAERETEADPVRRATLQQLRAAGVSFAPSQPDQGSMLDYSCLPRAVQRTAAAVPCSSDLSLEMNTLAMKYVDSRALMQRAAAVGGRPTPHPVEARLLGKENLAPPSRGRPTDMTMYGISDTNMSFSTRKYMEKFNLQS